MCRGDGSMLLAVLRSGCACGGQEPGPPQVAGWLDLVSSEFVPGPVPADAGPCEQGGGTPGGCGTVSTLTLCDRADGGGPVAFLRHLAYTCDGEPVGQWDTLIDGTTPYTPVGEIGPCQPSEGEPCEPAPACPGLVGLSGPEEWTLPAQADSVQVTVVCPPVTVIPCGGATAGVEIRECGVSLGWSAPGTGCRPGTLCEDFRVVVPDGAAAYVSWTSTCETGP